jgi:hypothetical protein
MVKLPLSLTQLFGEGSTQDINNLVIRKNDLPGLTPNATNTAESIFAALLLKSLENFEGFVTDENGNAVTNENDIPISYDNINVFLLLKVFQWESRLIEREYLFLVKTIVVNLFSNNET